MVNKPVSVVAGQENEQRALPGLGGDWTNFGLIGSFACNLLHHHYNTDVTCNLLDHHYDTEVNGTNVWLLGWSACSPIS